MGMRQRKLKSERDREERGRVGDGRRKWDRDRQWEMQRDRHRETQRQTERDTETVRERKTERKKAGIPATITGNLIPLPPLLLASAPRIVISSSRLSFQILCIFKILFLLTRKYDPVLHDSCWTKHCYFTLSAGSVQIWPFNWLQQWASALELDSSGWNLLVVFKFTAQVNAVC